MNRKAYKELVLILLAAFCMFAVAAYFDLYERFRVWVDRYEEGPIDEVLLLAFFLAGALFIFAWRRWKKLNTEVARHSIAKQKLEHRRTTL